MPMKYGTSDIDAAYVGSDPVDAIYFGSDLVWPSEVLAPPDSFATLSMWFDPTYASSLTLSGSQVTNWASRAGSFNAAQATAAKRPLSGTRTVNGKNVLDFTAASEQVLDCGDVNDIGTDSLVLSCMFQLDITDVNFGLCGKHVFSSADGRYGLSTSTGGLAGVFDTDTLASGATARTSMPPVGLPVILTMRVTRNGAGSRSALWFNDTKVADIMFIDSGASWNITANWLIGSYAAQAGYYVDGVIGDIVMLKGTAASMPTDAELDPFIAWMMDKYAIPFHPWQLGGLQGWWKLDETVGTTAIDYSGRGRNSTYSGNYTLAGATGGPVNHADFGNGAGSRVAISDNDAFTNLLGMTLFALIKPDDVSTTQARQIVSKFNASNFEWGFNVNNSVAGRLEASMNGLAAGGAIQIETLTGLTTDWQAVVAALSIPTPGGRFGLWKNGVRGTTQGSTSAAAYANGTAQIQIGWRHDSNANQYFQGGIGNVLIFNIELSELRVRRLLTYFSDLGYSVAPPALPASGGGIETLLGDYKYYTFNTNGIFVPEPGVSYGVCVVAGGGAGGVNNGGGGGGGGVTKGTTTFEGPQDVMIGQGGVANPFDQIVQAVRNGGNSYLGPLMAVGGGSGGQYYGPGGAGAGPGGGLGGSGGGGARATTTAGLAYTGQGFQGGTGKSTSTYGGGGGGGAGAVGGNSTTQGGVGGAGVQTFTDSGVWVGGGGGGWWNSTNVAPGGIGGGGAGTTTAAGSGTAGTANTGGGGGASGGSGSGNVPQLAGSGGSGVVILRKAQTTYHASMKAAIAALSPTWSWDSAVGSGSLTAITGGVAMALGQGTPNYGRAIGSGGLVGVQFVNDSQFSATLGLTDDAAFSFFLVVNANGAVLPDASNYVLMSTGTAGQSSFNFGLLCMLLSNEGYPYGIVTKTSLIRQEAQDPTARVGTTLTYLLTYSGTAVKLYINGVNIINAAYSGGVDHNGIMRLGMTLGNVAANVSPFRGVLGYPAMWLGTALSDSDATALHAASGL